MPAYLKCKYIFFFISISGRIRNIFPAEPDPDPDPWKKMSDPHPWIIVDPISIVNRIQSTRIRNPDIYPCILYVQEVVTL